MVIIPLLDKSGSEGRNYTSLMRRFALPCRPRKELMQAMAVPHFSVTIIARGSGRSAVLSAAYRHCARMEFEREARTIDYRAKQGLLHEAFVIPTNAPEWLRSMIGERTVSEASEAFWNAVEGFEKRSDAQLAKDVTIALPVELSPAQNIELVRDFVSRHITAKGIVADWVFHDAPGNPHIHLMTTLRPLTREGFGSKKVAVTGADGHALRSDNGKIIYQPWAGGLDDFNAFRDGWFACQNKHLALAGLDISIDGRSFEKQGVELTPTIHLGVGTKAIERKAIDGNLWADKKAALERVELQERRRVENARRIQRNPQIVLDLIIREKSVFDDRDVTKILHRYIDDPVHFRSVMARILESPETLRLDRERIDFGTGLRIPAKYTTHALIRLEAEMMNRAIWLSKRSSHGVAKSVLRNTFVRHARLSDEQRGAIEHVAGIERIAAVIGRAGAGKTTMMKAASEAWEAAGYRVVGGALAGKAAEGLSIEAGIVSRTLASWELSWNEGRGLLDERCVFVLDEAGMVPSRQMANFVEAVTKAGAKLVLIGDAEQLQPIEAGAAFRAITECIGYAELQTIYRQREPWMRDASLQLARGEIGLAVSIYEAHGRMVGAEKKADAVIQLIADWNRHYDPSKSTLILAHLRRDVRLLNTLARAKLVERGLIAEGCVFQTADGVRRFAVGDQVVFLKNENALGVKNGMLGRVLGAAPGQIVVALGNGKQGASVRVEQRFYNNVDHGYATTVHKAQGATVDRVKLLASLSLDRHLTYVAMTRHREDLRIYYGRRSFATAGGLVDIISRRNSKETTLDYAGSGIYAQALRFAARRGLHIINVARVIAQDRLEWTLRQKQKLVRLIDRLSVIGAKLGLGTAPACAVPTGTRKAKPMVTGMVAHQKSISQAIEDRLAAEPGLKAQWQEVCMRLIQVFAEPEAAFVSINVDAMLRDQAVAAKTLARLATEPDAFGALKGKAGIFASRVEKEDRDRALRLVMALADTLSDYLGQRRDAERRLNLEELAVRRRAAIEIPPLSSKAEAVLERVRHAFDRSDLAAGLGYAKADLQVQAELKSFGLAVCERFGERIFLPVAAKNADGPVFQTVTSAMSATQKNEIAKAWSTMRTVQQLLAQERIVTAERASQAMRQTESKGIKLK